MLQGKIWEFFEKGDEGKPMQADRPGSEGSGESLFSFLSFFYV